MSALLSSTGAEVVDHLIKLGVAYALALPIGWTQERAERSAGLWAFDVDEASTRRSCRAQFGWTCSAVRRVL